MQISSPRESEARMTLTGVPGHVQGIAAATVEDWTHGCPKGCICKWISGKRTAECQNSAWDRVPTFELPDRIQVLQLANNPITTLPKQLFQDLGIINVQKMFLQNCNITEIHPDAFHGLEILIELDLRHNGIKQLHQGTFLGNKRIRKLWLSHNPLHTLSSFAFPSIPHLRILDLSHTRLSKLGRSTFMELEYLEVLHLRDNHFRRLDKRVFLPMQQLKSLTLERNPWQCDCRLLDFWQWLMKENLFSLPTACESPKKLEGTTWDKLSVGLLACPPEVMVPEPMVTVSTGSKVQLGCLVTENPGATMTWIRSGIEIANNSRHAEDGAQQKYVITTGLWDHKWFHRGQHSMENTIVSVIDGGEPQAHTRGRHDSRKRWFNLTIDNVHPSGSGSYTCVAQNSGGKAVGNVTVVYSETVATYLENSKISALLVVGTASGVLVFLCLSTFLVCLGVHRKHEHTRRRREQHLCLTASGPKSGSSLLAEMEDRPAEKEMNGSTSFCVERTKSFRLQKQRAIESFPDNEGVDDELGLELRPHKKLGPNDEMVSGRADAQHGMKSTNQIQPSPLLHSQGVTSKDLNSIDHEHLSLSVIPSVHPDSSSSFRHARDKLRENSGPSSSLIVKANSSASYSANSMLGSDADSGRGSMTAPSGSNLAQQPPSSSNQIGQKSKCGRDTLLSSASDSSSRGLNLTSQSVSSPTGHTTSPMDSTNSSCSTQSAFGHHQNILGSSSSTIIAKEQDQCSTTSGNTIRHASFPLNGCSMSVMDSMWRGGVGSSTHLFDESLGSMNCSGTATPNINGVVGFWSSANSPCNMRTLSKQSRRFQPNDLARHRHPAGNVIHADFTLPRGENLSSSRRLALNGPDFRATTLLSDRRLVPISGRDREIREISPTNHLGTPLHQHERKRNGNPRASSPSSASVSMSPAAWQAFSNDGSGVYSDEGLAMSGFNQKNRVTSSTNGGLDTELLVQEIETRRELLEALVKDKQDTVV